jgi:phosphohistidine phosphatase
MAEVLGHDTPLRLTDDLYLAGLGQIQENAQHWPEAAETILALGHNPGWEQALGNLSGTWHGMTTANAALLEGQGATWGEALEKTWRLEALLRPKDLS